MDDVKWQPVLEDARSLNHVPLPDGELRELCLLPGYGQGFLRLLRAGHRTAEHRHLKANKIWMLLSGHAVLTCDLNGIVTYHLMEPHRVFVVPALTWHKVTAVDGDALVFIWSDRIYDPDNPDKETR